jgi:hypothetical protein
MPIDDSAAGRMDMRDSDMSMREMDMQARKNGYCPNPNHSNARYAEHPEAEIKRRAFESKEGYSQKRFEAKLKDQMSGMPMPGHMRGRR